ncbi:MAG TPA: metallophosphoesterase, partial [Vicinamibacteria bacterium]|nr:metallophosphoesterase [Vicinamibacteria bacterium]
SNEEIFAAIPPRERVPIVMAVVVYAGLVLTTFLLAIGTLRPEEAEPAIAHGRRAGDTNPPIGIRHYEDVLRWDLNDYQRAWQRVTRAQLVDEMAEQAHGVAEANRRKFRTLALLFLGLQAMTALAVVLVVGIGAVLMLEGQSEKIKLKGGMTITIPALTGSPAASEAGAGEAGNGPARDWNRFPAVVDKSTNEEIVALGDVHGAYDRLLHLLQVGGIARADPKAKGGYAWAGGKRTLVSVGDLIDKGPQSLEVLDLMMSLQSGARAAGGDVIVTLGNHEAEFLARPGKKKKAEEFDRELSERHIDLHDVAEGRNAYGRFFLGLPVAARVNGWFFSHAGSTSGMSLTQIGDRFRAVVDSGRWKNPFLIGDDSLLEARKWWKGDMDDKDLAALPAAHIVFGHDPGAFRDKGTIQTKNGRLFLIDVGMTPEFDYSKGALMLIDRKDGLDVATSLDASGARREVWRGPAPHGS